MKSLLLLICLSCFLGCATSYKPTGDGYSEFQLTKNSYLVMFSGNEYTSPKLVQEGFIKRSSELTLLNSFLCFQADSVSTDSKSIIINENLHAKYTTSGIILMSNEACESKIDPNYILKDYSPYYILLKVNR